MVTKKQPPPITVSLEEGRFGVPMPTITVALPNAAHHRKTSARLHVIAAAIEEATPPREGWTVNLELRGEAVGFVYLELATGSAYETKCGMQVLQKVAAACGEEWQMFVGKKPVRP